MYLSRNTARRFWLLQVAGWSVYALDRYLSEESFFPFYFIYLCVAFALTSVLLRPLYRAIYRRRRAPRELLAVGVAASVLAAVLWLLLARIVFVALGLSRPPTQPLPKYLMDTMVMALTYHKPFLFLSWSGIYFGTKLWLDAQERERSAFGAVAAARDAELQALRAQLNPHFLFNALNSTGALIREDPVRAERVLDELAAFLRHALSAASPGEQLLEEELRMVRAYLTIEQLRHEPNLEVQFVVSPAALGWRLPSLVLQPLAENGVKYGIRTSAMPVRIVVEAAATAATLTVTVRHTGHLLAPRDADERDGVGLANVRRRLALAFPQRHSFDLLEQDGWVHATIAITADERGAACGC